MAGNTEVNFGAVEKALAKEPAPPVMLEYSFEKALCEQLIWRRGEHLWREERTKLSAFLEGSRRAGFPGAVLAVSDAALIDALRREADGMGLICGPAAALCAPSEAYVRKTAEIAGKADAVFLQGVFSGDAGKNREVLDCLKLACEAVHRAGKRVIWADRSAFPLSPERIAELPFDGLQLNSRYKFTTEEAIQEYGERFCLFGRTDLPALAEKSPMELIREAARLWELCGGKGYIFGTGNISGRPIPYLTFISMITAVNRLR